MNFINVPRVTNSQRTTPKAHLQRKTKIIVNLRSRRNHCVFKVSVVVPTKRNKIFSTTFWFLFSPVSRTCSHLFVFISKGFHAFSHIVHTKTLESADENDSMWCFFLHRFQKPPFSFHPDSN